LKINFLKKVKFIFFFASVIGALISDAMSVPDYDQISGYISIEEGKYKKDEYRKDGRRSGKVISITNEIKELVIASLTPDNLERLSRHNLRSRHIEELNHKRSTINFVLPRNGRTQAALNAAALENNEQRNAAVAGLTAEELKEVKKIMKKSIENFLNLKRLNVRTGTRNENFIEIYTTVTRDEFFKIQGHEGDRMDDEAGSGFNLCLIISNTDGLRIHHFWMI